MIDRLRPKLAEVIGVNLYLQPAQDITVGGRIARAQYQYTLQDIDFAELNTWAPRMLAKLKALPQLADVSSDQQNLGPQLTAKINRDAAARFGIQPQVIDDSLNDAFGQRQVAQYYTQRNTYNVVLEALPGLQANASALDQIYVKSPTTGQLIPLSTLVTIDTDHTGPLSISHQGQFPAATLSFNLQPGVALSQAVDAIDKARAELGAPATLIGTLPGQRPGVPDRARQRAAPDPRRAARRLRHPRRALRELRPPADDPLHPALGRRRRADRAVGGRVRPLGHRHHRDHPADRHRQEERHHAGRLRDQPRARGLFAARTRSARPACCGSGRS